MNRNHIAIHIRKRDYFKLPQHCRQQDEHGPLVLSKVRGNEVFVPAVILE